jgi:hypothetical protein
MMFLDTCTEAITQLLVVGWFLLALKLFYLIMELLMFCSGGLNLFTDVLLIILPFPILLALTIKWTR